MDRLKLYDFWAPWCAPCRAMAPTVEAVAEKFKDKIELVKVNVDDDPDLAAQYGVRSIPTLVLTNGEEKLRVVGARQPAVLELAIQQALG